MAYLDERPWRSRLVVVDNGSVDETAADARIAAARTDKVDVTVISAARGSTCCSTPGTGSTTRSTAGS